MELTRWFVLCVIVGPVLSILKHIPICDVRRNLTPQQVGLCRKFYSSHVTLIIDAKYISDLECRNQFANQRWNCTLPEAQTVLALLLPILPMANKESAYIYASTSAALMHTVSRGCMEGKLSSFCSCSNEGRPESLHRAHVWGGCGDNLPYGYRFSKVFMDAGEQLSDDTLSGFSRVLMNLHNNEAGRWAVYEKSYIQCRCHGVSMNCATKTCHRQLGRFKLVAKHLETLHDKAIQVKLIQNNQKKASQNTEMKLVETNSNGNKYSPKDLVYIDKSPSYCEKDLSIGSYGVTGRQCTKTGTSKTDCNVKCCERGYYSRREIVETKCGCKFVWCCKVKCKTCVKEQNNHYCK